MKLSISDLKTERQWRSATGYAPERFNELLPLFEAAYEKIHGESLESVKAKIPKESVMASCEELLFFTLFSLKAGLTYDVLGLVTGMDGSTAKRNHELGVKVLKEALKEHAPMREVKSLGEFRKLFSGHETLIIDRTEQLTERPQDKAEQKQNYSGKKKLTPLKQRSLRRRTSKSDT